MACVFGDQDLRVQLSKEGVVHAATIKKYGGFKRTIHPPNRGDVIVEDVPVEDRIYIACHRYRDSLKIGSDQLVPNNTEITCKSCMKLMGLIDASANQKRYVIVNTETGEFSKNNATRCTLWSNNIYEAFFYKVRGTAERNCKQAHYRVGDRLLTYKEWRESGRPPFKTEYCWLPNLAVKQVKVTLIDEE